MMELPKLVIEQTPDGRIQVSGPIGNKVLAYGMIEAAKDAIRVYGSKEPQQIQPVSFIPPHLVKGNNNGEL